MPNYGDPKYWDKRYAENAGSMFDWLEDYQSLKPLLQQLVPDTEAKILIIGCGNAPLSEDMYDDGYHNILNLDISSVVIEQMTQRNSDSRPLMRYQVMDCTEMNDISDSSFDVAIDKSTIDALLCGNSAYLNVAKMTKEIQRVIKPESGLYIAISYGKPESRQVHFEREHLSFAMKQFILYPAECTEEQKEEKSHYIYVARKQADADQVVAENWEKVVAQLKREAEAEAALAKDPDVGSEGCLSDDEGQRSEAAATSKVAEHKKKKAIHFRSFSS